MNIPSTMRAVVLTGHGGLDKLSYREDWPTPTPQAGEALIKVAACGLNNTDINTRTAWYSKAVNSGTTNDGIKTESADTAEQDASWGGNAITFPRIQGADPVGTVVALGNGAPKSLLGQRVMIETWLCSDNAGTSSIGYFGSECDGGYADYTVAPVRNIHPIDCPLSDAELATFATSYVTAENMLTRAGVKTGDAVLITGASGGVGSALIQLTARRGAIPVGMATENKHAALAPLGCPLLPREPENLKVALQQAIGRADVDVIADVVGGDSWRQWINVLHRSGRYVVSGAIAGPMVELDLRTLYLQDLIFYGATVAPPLIFSNLVNYITRGEIKPLLAKTFPLRELTQAQEMFVAKKHIGNIVVTMA
ncbi:alcohol dehydrogenase family protein [Candidatus Persebacteraceae bacterium Df01]|jgi:NADPH:quinone reductase-like Zn-dependent oxidoreductase|uniref:Alcohol dehydrogenase family protein n=1 Tax=Candidatus Doriopsillibacter californiensis TaxID=2970740 RepID=A0ABT7QLK5_9GAMM|nr:alcohol dehydrogenase family protein [Candidatus Persebacteraceae bacterium Df01]